jgi:hypothetical protein
VLINTLGLIVGYTAYLIDGSGKGLMIWCGTFLFVALYDFFKLFPREENIDGEDNNA